MLESGLQRNEEFALLNLINQHIVGVFWHTKDKLSLRPFHFAPLDYMFNGLLSMHLQGQQLKKGMNFFASTSFGHSLFLTHFSQQDEQTNVSEESVMSRLVELCAPVAVEQKSVIVICDDAKELSKKFTKRFPGIKFIPFDQAP